MSSAASAHSGSEQATRFKKYQAENISVLSFIKSPLNYVPAMLHSHSEYEFIIPLTPIPFLVSEGAIYFGDVGYVFPVQSGRQHGIKYSTADVAHDDIIIDKTYFEAMLQSKGCAGLEFNGTFEVSDELKMYVHAFKEECKKAEFCDKHKLKHLTALICCEIIDAGNDNTDSRREAINYQRGLRSAAEYINCNFDKQFKLAELAAACGVTPNYFSSRFKLMYGMSPFTYITKLRVSTAKNMLSSTELSITEIAGKCGFLNVCSLSAAFKSSTGMSPSEYRKKEKSFRFRPL